MSARKLALTFAMLMLLNFFAFYFRLLLPYFAFATFFGFLVYLLVYLNEAANKKGISLKVPKEFVHAKLYIGDSKAIESSANLTFTGMHKNIEHARVIDSPEDLSKLRKEFESLWKDLTYL